MRHAHVFGVLGPNCPASTRKDWNALLKKSQIDGFFDFYATKTPFGLQTRLSEMFLLQRRGYLIHPSLQAAAVPLMDRLSAEAQKEGKVDAVKNERGVLVGDFLGKASAEETLRFWLGKGDRE